MCTSEQSGLFYKVWMPGVHFLVPYSVMSFTSALRDWKRSRASGFNPLLRQVRKADLLANGDDRPRDLSRLLICANQLNSVDFVPARHDVGG
jgi:hypothetical protein